MPTFFCILVGSSTLVCATVKIKYCSVKMLMVCHHKHDFSASL